MRYSRTYIASLFVAGLFLLGTQGVSAQVTTYGTLDNFDVVNDTGVETHGFEIELEGVSPAEVLYTFGAPYERYGDPEIISNGSGGAIVRYKATYDTGTHTWSAGTPVASQFPPTDGHSCWSSGDPNYPNVGCDHFGISLNVTPTNTTYRWLIENPSAPGTLQTFGTNVPLPVPVWNVTPPADPAVDQPVAIAVINPVPSDDPSVCGEAMWVKVYTTELPDPISPDDLDHMVVDDANVDIVPEPAEVEFEWMLLQSCPGKSGELQFGNNVEVGAGNEAVSRRFEFYKYTGAYDPDPEAIQEAMCDNPLEVAQQTPDRCGEPNGEGVAGVGGYIGKQNAAINVAGPFAQPLVAPVAVDDEATTDEDAPTTISVIGNDTDADGTIDPTTVDLDPGTAGVQTSLSTPDGVWTTDGVGSVTFAPTLNWHGVALASYTVMDNDAQVSNTATLTVTVTSVNDTPIADAGTDQIASPRDVVTLDGTASSDVDGDTLTYAWVLTTKPARSKVVLSGETTVHPSFAADKEGAYVLSLVVNDGALDSGADIVTVDVMRTKKK